MTIARVTSFAFAGIRAIPVEVQVQLASGMPGFAIVGLPDKAVGESRERVRAALAGIGLSLPPKRVLVNLAPADILKEGSHFDLPIALGLLAAIEVLPREDLAGYAALGELSLDGRINPVAGVLAAALGASAVGLGLICPAAQGGEAAWAGRIEVLAAPDLPAILNHIRGLQVLTPPEPPGPEPAPPLVPCLSAVKGQESAKRAVEIAAAGGHNLLMIGPPGAGKSMLAACLPGLLPALTPAEALEVSLVHSVAGLLHGGRLVTRPPYRHPHHSASQPALVGGGPRGRPGEISLAHLGVLFLDEWPEFPRPALEALRQPMETGLASISRVNSHIDYPAQFQCVAAMNPCRCGKFGGSGECGRAPRCAEEYQGKLSGPLLDRMDLTIDLQSVTAAEMGRAPKGEASAVVALRVAAARARQRARQGEAGPRCNAVADHATLDALPTEAAALDLLERAADRLGLSGRGYTRTRRVARTIADLAGSATVLRAHVAEALAFRMRGPARRQSAA